MNYNDLTVDVIGMMGLGLGVHHPLLWPNMEIVPFRLVNYIAIQAALLLGYNPCYGHISICCKCTSRYYTCLYIYNYIYIYELQPKFRLMESSIRDIFIFWKLSWGLENDNTLFKQR